MTGSLTKTFRRRLRRTPAEERAVEATPAEAGADEAAPIDIAPNDPLLAYLQSATGAVDVEALELDSPALAELKAAGVKLVVPLVSQGELIGVLNLGPRLSEQEYSSDDRKLLDNLAAQAAPALRVGQLVRQQQAEAATRERFEQELEVARLIQQNFLPKELPELPGWQVAAYYRPAREVGGDFYDFIPLPDGRVGFVVGDVTDKGVPAALVMAATRSVLRASAQRLIEPGERARARQRAPLPGHAGEDVRHLPVRRARPARPATSASPTPATTCPYVKTADGLEELRARGMPLGLMPGMPYEEKETVLQPGDSRAAALRRHRRGAQTPTARCSASRASSSAVADYPGGGELIDRVLADAARLHRPRRRAGGRHHHGHPPALAGRRALANGAVPAAVLAEFEVAERAGQRARGDRARRERGRTASACRAPRVWSA